MCGVFGPWMASRLLCGGPDPCAGDCAPVGGGILTWVLTRMTIILQGGPKAWRCRVIALEEEGPESGVPLDPVKVDVDGDWAGPHRLGLSPSNGWGLEEQVWVSKGAPRKWPPHTHPGPTGQVSTALPANLAWPERYSTVSGAPPPRAAARQGGGGEGLPPQGPPPLPPLRLATQQAHRAIGYKQLAVLGTP